MPACPRRTINFRRNESGRTGANEPILKGNEILEFSAIDDFLVFRICLRTVANDRLR